MNASQKRSFYYHADANALGGHLTAPVQKVLATQGSASLAQAGGHVQSDAGPFASDSVVSFKSAHSEIHGHTKTDKGGSWHTSVTSVVEGLNILDIVRADSITAYLEAAHPHGGYHPSISFEGSQIVNLSIHGKVVALTLDLASFARTDAQSAASADPWEHDPTLLQAAVAHNQRLTNATDAPGWVKNRYGWMTSPAERGKRGHVVCSVVKEIRGTEPHPTFGHLIHVPDVGNLFLGEISVSRGLFALTMLRVEMGCAADGDLSVATGNTNGRPMP